MKNKFTLLNFPFFIFLLVLESSSGKNGFFSIKNIDGGLNIMPASFERNNRAFDNFTLSYSSGLLLRFVDSKNNGLTLGFSFTNYRTKSGFFYYSNNTSTPGNYDTTINKVRYYYSDKLIEIPLILNIKLAGNKNIFTINPGLVPQYYLSTKMTSEIYYHDSRKELYERWGDRGLEEISIAWQLSLGVERSISEKLFAKVEPTVRGGFDLRDNWLFGVNFSLLRRF